MSVLICALVSVGVTIIIFKVWYIPHLITGYVTRNETDMSHIPKDGVVNVDYELPLDEISTVMKQSESKDTTEYQELGGREVNNMPNSYAIIRVM